MTNKYDDLTRIDITDEMMAIAKDDADFFRVNYGYNTRPAYEDRDLVGSLAHQVVDIAFDNLNLPYKSFRKVRRIGGDECDIIYENDWIDVKGTHGNYNHRWVDYREFLIFKNQLEDKKINKITHFMFVLINFELKCGWIFGVISKEKFLSEAKQVNLKYENLSITAGQLKPFRDYVFRTGGGE